MVLSRQCVVGVLGLATMVAAACDHGPVDPVTRPEVPALRVAERTFDVLSVNGQRLPARAAVRGRGLCDTLHLGWVRLAFGDQGFLMSFAAAGVPTETGSSQNGDYVQAADGSISLSDGGQGGAGQLRGDTLTLSVRGGLPCGEWKLVALVRPRG